jgi:hypothetical protein
MENDNQTANQPAVADYLFLNFQIINSFIGSDSASNLIIKKQDSMLSFRKEISIYYNILLLLYKNGKKKQSKHNAAVYCIACILYEFGLHNNPSLRLYH